MLDYFLEIKIKSERWTHLDEEPLVQTCVLGAAQTDVVSNATEISRRWDLGSGVKVRRLFVGATARVRVGFLLGKLHKY